MRFANETDIIPRAIFDAIENNKLIIFAGAGISKPEPANLPNFIELANLLAQNTALRGRDLTKVQVDRFLGELADLNPASPYLIHEQIVEKFAQVNTPNELHKNILKIFSSGKIKIITTNFDRLLSVAAEEMNIPLSQYCAPALPLGDEFEGIAYLHGCIDGDAKNLVVTDKDFSQAYVCRGWASKFIKDAFTNNVILFIGYSYNDTILKYLTRGIASKNLYILAPEDDEQNWEYLGVIPIKYKNDDGSHIVLRELLEKWGKHSSQDIVSEMKEIENIAKSFPAGLDEKQIEYVKSHIFTKNYRVKHFLENTGANSTKWLRWLFDNNYLEKIFSHNAKSELTDVEKSMVDWFCNHFMEDESLYKKTYWGEADGIVIDILKKYYYRISDELASMVAWFFHANGIKNQSIYLTWLEPLLNSSNAKWGLLSYFTYHLGICIKEKYKTASIILLEFLLDSHFDHRKVELNLNIKDYWLKKYYKNLADYATDIVPIAINSIIKANYLKRITYNSPDEVSLSLLSIKSIEDCDQDEEGSRDALALLITILKNALDELFDKNVALAKAYTITCLESDISILNRVGIYGLYSNMVLSANEVLDCFIQKDWLFKIELKHEIRHYFRLNYLQLASDYKEKLFKLLFDEPENESEEELWKTLSFLRYIKNNKINESCEILKKHYYEVSSKFPYPVEETSDELDSYSMSSIVCGFVSYNWCVSVEELLRYDVTNKKVLEELQNAQGDELIEDKVIRQSRKGVLERITEVSKKDAKWAIRLLENLITNDYKESDMYPAILEGLKETKFKTHSFERNVNKILTLFNSNFEYSKLTRDVIYRLLEFIKSILRHEEQKQYSQELICLLKTTLISIWSAQNNQETVRERDAFQQAINTIEGSVVETLLSLLWLEYKQANNDKNVFDFYKNFFENEIINQSSFKAQIGLAIISNRICFLHSFDNSWTSQNLMSKLNYRLQEASIAWNGFLICSPRWYEKIIEDLTPYFNEIIKNNIKLQIEYWERFYDFYLVMFVYSMLYLPENIKEFDLHQLVNQLDENEIEHWCHTLKEILNNNVPSERMQEILGWVLGYWRDRLRCCNEKEKAYLLKLIFSLQDYFLECLKIIKTTNYNFFDDFIFYELKESEIFKNYPAETIELLNHIINDNSRGSMQWHSDCLKDLIEEFILLGVQSNELKNLLNKLVRYNYGWGIELLRKIS